MMMDSCRYRTQHISLGSVNLSNYLQVKPPFVKFYTRYKIKEKQEVTEKSLDVADILPYSFILRITLFYCTRNAMKNEIDVRNVLLGTFNNPIASILL